jgi:hypothetical protein
MASKGAATSRLHSRTTSTPKLATDRQEQDRERALKGRRGVPNKKRGAWAPLPGCWTKWRGGRDLSIWTVIRA